MIFYKVSQGFKTAIRFLVVMTLFTGLIYPLCITAYAQLFFPWQANGSLIEQDGVVVGSKWIGQYFSSPAYFSGRPSATEPKPYQGNASGGSNLGPSNQVLYNRIHEHVVRIKQENCCSPTVPIDLVTASGSGLDPHISPQAAFYQARRIAKTRNLPMVLVYFLITQHIETRTFGVLGEPRVNVLLLNLELDQLRNPDVKNG